MMALSVAQVEDVAALERAASDETVLAIEHLSVRLQRRGQIGILDDINYTVRKGEAIAIVGESGAGKSISTRAALDLLDPLRFIVEGSIKLCGQELLTLPRKRRRQYISRHASMVFQDPTRALNPSMRVGEQIAEAMLRRDPPTTRKDARTRALELIRAVGIADPEERFYAFPHQLSGGMRQRIVIAIAIACSPQIIFCDEPTSGLDVTTQALIMDLLQDLRRQLDVAIVLITHDLLLAASRVDTVVVMYRGRLAERLPSATLFDGAAMPYTQALLAAMPRLDGEMPRAMPIASNTLPLSGAGCRYSGVCPRARDICRRETPPRVSIAANHDVWCFFPGPTKPGEVAA
jgi:oligopeptide/dipeptide ABC transporter ATP-binding protein